MWCNPGSDCVYKVSFVSVHFSCRLSVVSCICHLSDPLSIVRLTKIKQSFYLRLPTAALHFGVLSPEFSCYGFHLNNPIQPTKPTTLMTLAALQPYWLAILHAWSLDWFAAFRIAVVLHVQAPGNSFVVEIERVGHLQFRKSMYFTHGLYNKHVICLISIHSLRISRHLRH